MDNKGKILDSLLLFLVSLWDIAALMILIVSLENRCFVSGTPTNSIMSAHNISQLVKIGENVDTNTTIETSWLKQPKIELVVAAIRNFVWSLGRFLFRLLVLVKLLVDAFPV